jgi:hypothetical protein
MDRHSEKPLRLFVNPFAIWTQWAFKTTEAMWASAHAAALRANAPRVTLIPTVGALRKAPVRQASKAARFKATRAKVRSRINGKRRGGLRTN